MLYSLTPKGQRVGRSGADGLNLAFRSVLFVHTYFSTFEFVADI